MHRRTSLGTAAAAGPLTGRLAAEEAPIRVRAAYYRDGGFSDLALSLEGARVRFQGCMAPPLKAEARFAVLTNMPMAVCPFCQTEADWPQDILAIYAKRIVEPPYFTVGIETGGVLELGTVTDPDTGFGSPVRLSDATCG